MKHLSSSVASSEQVKENSVPEGGKIEREHSNIFTPKKSLIPKPHDKLSPARLALTPIQRSGTPKENEMVGHKRASSGTGNSSGIIGKLGDKSKSQQRLSANGAGSSPKTKSGQSKLISTLVKKQRIAEKACQTENVADLEMVTAEEAPLNYWKELAEQRRIALEESLKENEDLHHRVDELEKENKILDEMVEQAKSLAEIINSISDEADESGIGRDSEDTGYEQDLDP